MLILKKSPPSKNNNLLFLLGRDYLVSRFHPVSCLKTSSFILFQALGRGHDFHRLSLVGLTISSSPTSLALLN